MGANKNSNMYTLSFLKDLYTKRQSVIDILNKPYWLFCLESNNTLHNKIINFIDGDILGTFLEDVQLLPDLQGDPSYRVDHVWKSNRLLLKFLFQRGNGVVKNSELCIYYVDHSTGTLMLDWTKTRLARTWVGSDDWKYGGPVLLDVSSKFKEYAWQRGGISEDERTGSGRDGTWIWLCKGGSFSFRPSFHSGIKRVWERKWNHSSKSSGAKYKVTI